MTSRYVNTASTAGGNGTTNATSGANRAYASLAEWEAAEQAVLTEDHTVLCCGATNDTETTIDGWTPSGFRIIVAGNTGDAAGAHAGKWDTAYYTIGSASSVSAAIVPVEENVTIQDIQATNSDTVGIGLGRFGQVGNDLIIDRCVIKGPGTGGSSFGLGLQDASNLRQIARNCVVHDWFYGAYMRAANTSNVGQLVNTTITQCSTGARGRSNVRAINVLNVFNTTDWYADISGWDTANCYYNAFVNSGTNCPGSTDIDLSAYAATDLFLDNANEDFHLLSSGSAYASVDDGGVGPSSNSAVPADDIDGDARSGTTTSVGADIIVAAGGDTALVSTVQARAVVVASFLTGISLLGAVLGSASMQAPMSTSISLLSATTASATVSSSLTVAIPISAATTALATASASLSTSIPLSAGIFSRTQTAAGLSTAIPLTSVSTAISIVTASFDALGAELVSGAQARATVVGNLSTSISLTAPLTARAMSVAGITTAIPLAAQLTALGRAQAVLASVSEFTVYAGHTHVKVLPHSTRVRSIKWSNRARILNA